MKAKVVLLSRTDGRESFMVRLSEKGRKAYKKIVVPFSVKMWNYNPKKKKNELKKVTPRFVDEYKIYKRNKSYVDSIEEKYQNQIDVLISKEESFSFQKVIDMVETPLDKKPTTVYKMFEARIKEMKADDKFSNALGYKGTFNKLKAFHKKDMLFSEMDSNILLKFRKSMENGSLSKATISIHLRNIRALYNLAIKRGVASANHYPFKNDDIMKGTKSGRRAKAISMHFVNEIREQRTEYEKGSGEWEACNYFIFGYVGRGINFTDIVRLKWADYLDGRIKFVRQKTRSKVDEESSFAITDELQEIIDWYQKQNNELKTPSPYIFPVLTSFHNTEKKIFNRIKKVRKQVNADLKTVGKKIKSPIPLTTYVWRHTFASVAKNELNVSIAMISESLGHSDLETTKHYLESFPNKDLDKAYAGL